MPTASIAVARAAWPSDAELLAAGAPKHQERMLLLQRPFGPGLNLFVKILGQAGGRPLRELSAAKLGGDVLHSTGADSLNHHLHEHQHGCLLRPLVALEESRQRTYLLGPAVPPVRSCRPESSAFAHTFRSGTPVDHRSPRRAWPLGVRSSRPVESGSLVGSRRIAIPRSPWSGWWIFSSSISISIVAIVVLLWLLVQPTYNLAERDGFFYSAGAVTQLIGHNLMLAIAFLYVRADELRNRGADENIFAGNHRLSSFKEAEPSGRTF